MVQVIPRLTDMSLIPAAADILATAIQMFKPIADELARLETRLNAPDLPADARARTAEIIKLIVVPILNEIERVDGFHITLEFKSNTVRMQHGSLRRKPSGVTKPSADTLGTAVANALTEPRIGS